MNFLGLLFLLVIHLLSGSGLIKSFRVTLKPVMHLSLSLITGLLVASLLPFLLQLFWLPITPFSCGLSLCLAAIACNIAVLLRRPADVIPVRFKDISFRIEAAEWPFIIAVAFLLGLSFWQSYYFPMIPRDMLSGPEPIAEFALKEKTLLNSALSVNLETTNNHLKPLFVTSLLVIYKMFVSAFGGTWVTLLATGFTIFFYQVLKSRLHPLFAGLLMLLFVCTPEMYGYTYMALFDYGNMALLFITCYFLKQYLKQRSMSLLLFTAVMGGFATYIRSETLVLLVLLAPVLLYHERGEKGWFPRAVWQGLIFLLPSVLFYVLCIEVYNKHYIPGGFDVGSLGNKNLTNLQPFWDRFAGMNKTFIFGEISYLYFGWSFILPVVLIAADLLIHRKLQKGARFWLYVSLVVYIGLPLLGFLLPLFDLMNTTKRGLFKLVPPLFAVLMYNTLLQKISVRISNWYHETKPVTPVAVTPQPKPKASPAAARTGSKKK